MMVSARPEMIRNGHFNRLELKQVRPARQSRPGSKKRIWLEHFLDATKIDFRKSVRYFR